MYFSRRDAQGNGDAWYVFFLCLRPVSERFVELLPTNQSLRDLVTGAVCATLGCGVGLLDIALVSRPLRALVVHILAVSLNRNIF